MTQETVPTNSTWPVTMVLLEDNYEVGKVRDEQLENDIP